MEASWSGPIPSPDVLNAYDDEARGLVLDRMRADTELVRANAEDVRAISGSRRRLIDALVEIDAKSEDAESADLERSHRDTRLAVTMTFVLILVAMVCFTLCVLNDHTDVAYWFLAIIGAFMGIGAIKDWLGPGKE